jgi:hypothetical protein
VRHIVYNAGKGAQAQHLTRVEPNGSQLVGKSAEKGNGWALR